MTASNHYCTFFLDDLLLGVEVHTVQEVIRYRPLTRVPLAPPEVSGLMNLRGQIVTAIDTRRRLGLKPRPENKLPINVVIRTEAGPLSLLVDDIGDVLEVTDDNFERPPATLHGPAREWIRGAYKLQTPVKKGTGPFQSSPSPLNHEWPERSGSLFHRQDTLLLILETEAERPT